MSERTKHNLLEVIKLAIVLGGFMLGNFFLLRAVVRDVVREEMLHYERKEQAELIWQAHGREMAEVRRGYDERFREVERRLSQLELWRPRP